ncbi:SusC/RagA family TonB-linked outer membrane protein [Chitinophaga defluvii]|uniref:TonB-dependent receptor n=1 Tax=Chitinophaga defluvii TaxID=3163343 RepID=A0ABV2T7L8_9BACT
MYQPRSSFLALFCMMMLGGKLSASPTSRGVTEFSSLQQHKLSGTVVSADNMPLPGVSVSVKGTSNGVTTDNNGRYNIIAKQGDVLQFRYVGYITREVTAGTSATLNVVLQPDVKTLNSLVVVGYGKQSREMLTTSISKLDTKVFDNVPYANAANALQGSIAGVRVQTTSGQPGAAPRIILRGGTSINNPNGAAPLYIIDGVIRTDMNDINGDDIESLQVLKDAAATSIYGARGANGVIIITTKTGKAGKIQISYKYDVTVSQLAKKYDLVSARDYVYYGRMGILARAEKDPTKLNSLGLATGYGTGNNLTKNTYATTQYLTAENEHKLNEGWESIPDPADPTKTLIFKGTDWQDMLFRTSVSHNHYINASGGTEKANFNLGVGYLTTDGIAINSGFKRFAANLNGGLKLKENLRVKAMANFTNSKDNQVFNVNQIFERALALPPTVKYTFEDGTLAPGQNRSIGNPVYQLSRSDSYNNLNRITLGGGLDWDILPGLKFEPSASLYVVQTANNAFQKSYYDGVASFIDSRVASTSSSTYWQKQADAVFTYNKQLSKHSLEANLGGSYYDRKDLSQSASGRGATTDLVPTLNASAEPVSVSSSSSSQRLIGFFGRINYNYDQKYLLSINSRYDGASNLGKNNRWGIFPGISAGWNMHNESFWQGSITNWVNKLKLRASYGVNGNLGGLGDFQAQGVYAVGGRYNSQGVILNNTMPNPDLQWEQTETFDMGFDLGLLNDRISILFDYYNKRTDHLLTNLSLPKETGFESILTNYGSLQNRGIEVELSAVIIQSKSGFNWNMGFNIATNVQKILSLPDNINERNRVGGVYVYDPAAGKYDWKGGLQEGGRIGDLYAYKQSGIYATDKEAADGPYDVLVQGLDKRKFGGDVNWLDTDRNDTIDTRDQVYMGNIYPRVTGGLSSYFSYKNISLTVRMDYTLGHTIYNYSRAGFDGQFQGDIGITSDIYRSWKKQGDQTDIPRYYWADQQAQNNIFRGNSIFYEKGDFLALREVSIAYSLPTSLLSVLRISNLRLNFTANNLKYFTKYKGLNPEDGGTDNGRYPIPRSYILGANVTF